MNSASVSDVLLNSVTVIHGLTDSVLYGGLYYRGGGLAMQAMACDIAIILLI